MTNQLAALAGREPPAKMEAPLPEPWARSACRARRGETGKLARTMLKEARHR
jgi:hypothetical protein